MFKIDLKKKKLTEVDETNLEERNLQERNDLQQWIKSNPAILAQHFDTDIKIISEEFDEFDVSDRLDLLGIDPDGNLIIIELKRKDSGSRTDIQGLKYASYCSTLTPQRIVEIYQKYITKNNLSISPLEDISKFISKDSDPDESNLTKLNSGQRIILVAQIFDPRVKSVVAWLGDQGIDISCVQFRVLEDTENKTLYLDTQKILPPETIDDYLIKDSSITNSSSKAAGKKIPQPPEVLRFLAEFKQIMLDRYSQLARGNDYVKYRTFKAGMGGLEFAFEVMKSNRRYKINLIGNDGDIGLLAAYEKAKAEIKPPKGYDLSFIDPSKSESKWARIQFFVEPQTPELYLKDAERVAKLTMDFIEAMAPVLRELKAA